MSKYEDMNEGQQQQYRSKKHRERLELNREDGNRLITKIVLEYTQEGYFCIARYGHQEGVDIIAIFLKNGKLCKVVECKNYREGNNIGKEEDFKKDLDNLNAFDIVPNVEKLFIVSFESIFSKEQKERLKRANVKIREIGYKV